MRLALPSILFPATLIFAVGIAANEAVNLVEIGMFGAASEDIYRIASKALATGLTWVVLGYLLTRLGRPAQVTGWALRIAAATIALGPVNLLMGSIFSFFVDSELYDPGFVWLTPLVWQAAFGWLMQPPYNVLVLAQGTVLVIVANWLSDAGAPLARGSGRGEAPTSDFGAGGPEQATRLLCGNAFLAGAGFRETVLSFYEKNWNAVAPEFGLDVKLLTAACIEARAHDRLFMPVFAGFAIFGALCLAAEAPFGVAACILAAAVLQFVRKRRQRTFAEMFRRDAFDPVSAAGRFAADPDRRVQDALPRNDQNLIVYRGFSPFVGAGMDLGGWSFATFVDKPAVAGEPDNIKAFTASELDAAICEAVTSLHIPELACRDFYFVRGTDVRGDSTVIADPALRPAQILGQNRRVLHDDATDTRVRRYKCIQVADWGGEMVISHYFRCALRGNTLFVELTRFLLPPLANDFRRVDMLQPDGIRVRIGIALEALISGPFVAVLAPFALFAAVQENFAEAMGREERLERRRRREIERNPAHDHGASTTLRAKFAQSAFLHFFQKSDADFWNKVIERKILDEIVSFLDAHGIDTTDIRERQMTILNSGILVQGGDVRAESLAVGKGANATKIGQVLPATRDGASQRERAKAGA